MNKHKDSRWRERELSSAVKSFFILLWNFLISYLVPECRIWLFEVHPCLTIFTGTNCASPIGLDCINFTKQGKDEGGERMEKQNVMKTHPLAQD